MFGVVLSAAALPVLVHSSMTARLCSPVSAQLRPLPSASREPVKDTSVEHQRPICLSYTSSELRAGRAALLRAAFTSSQRSEQMMVRRFTSVGEAAG